MKTFGLIGKPLSHSSSLNFFQGKFLKNKIFDAEYILFALDNIEEVTLLLKHPSLAGFNVTIPYKLAIIPYLDALDSIAKEVGAVNCVVKQNGKWIGYNTDVLGFEVLLKNAEKKTQNFAMVLGDGGAAKAVSYVLKQKKIPFCIISRQNKGHAMSFDDITEELLCQSSIIINTTPLGMYPNFNEKPLILYEAINESHILIDLIYNPEETSFLKEGKKRGAQIVNGLQMFRIQAKKSFELFCSITSTT